VSRTENRTGASYGVTIPADVDREDRLLFGLTARPATILAGAGVLAWLLALALGSVVPLPLALLLALPVLGAGLVLALGERDGCRWTGSCWPRSATPERPIGMSQPPKAFLIHPRCLARRRPRQPPAPLGLPAHGVDPDGVVDLAGDGAALLCQGQRSTSGCSPSPSRKPWSPRSRGSCMAWLARSSSSCAPSGKT